MRPEYKDFIKEAGTNDTCQIMVVDPGKAPGSRGRGMDAKTILSKA